MNVAEDDAGFFDAAPPSSSYPVYVRGGGRTLLQALPHQAGFAGRHGSWSGGHADDAGYLLRFAAW